MVRVVSHNWFSSLQLYFHCRFVISIFFKYVYSNTVHTDRPVPVTCKVIAKM